MSNEPTDLPVKSSNQLAVERTDWARTRTRQAAERTMMAILRTSLSLISFGFTIYKFFEAIREKLSGGGPIRAAGPRRLGLALVSLGVFVLAAGAVQHWKFMRELSVGARQKFPFSVSLTAAVILAIIGTTAFVTILARM